MVFKYYRVQKIVFDSHMLGHNRPPTMRGAHNLDHNTNTSFKRTYQTKAAPQMRNLKYRRGYSNYRQPKTAAYISEKGSHHTQHTSQKKEAIIHTIQHGQLHDGNQMFRLSYHYYIISMNLYYTCITYTKNPPITPLNDNRE